MPTITPSLWFNGNLEEAATFYTSVFPNSSVEGFARYTEAGPGTPGEVVSGTFVLDGQKFIGINGGRGRTIPVRLAQGQIRAQLAGGSQATP
jgi:predicted 3-demethylubiquinone-9 3-methyltransferase (glyoxalase superfamily)